MASKYFNQYQNLDSIVTMNGRIRTANGVVYTAPVWTRGEYRVCHFDGKPIYVKWNGGTREWEEQKVKGNDKETTTG